MGRCGWEREGGVGRVSEQECMVEVVEGEEEGRGKWGGREGRGSARGRMGGMDGLKEGVQEDSVVCNGEEWGGEMHEGREVIGEVDSGQGEALGKEATVRVAAFDGCF